MFRKQTEKLLSGIGIDPTAVAQARAALRPDARSFAATQQRLMGTGIELPATIRSFTPLAAIPTSRAQLVRLELSVEPPGTAPYAASVDQPLPDAVAASLEAGQRVTVKVARDDPQVLMLWNTPHAAGGADPDTGRPLARARDKRIERLEVLQELRAAGTITEPEFQARKADILGA